MRARCLAFLILPFVLTACPTTHGGGDFQVVVDPGEGDEAWRAAMAAYLAGDFERAILDFTSFADKHPRSPRAPEVPYWRGLSLLGAGHPEKALIYLDTALQQGAGIIALEDREQAVSAARAAIVRELAAVQGKEELFWVQAGAFSKQENADSLIAKLKEQGFRAKRVELVRGAGTLHAVRVGPVSGTAEAETLKLRLAQEAQISGVLVVQE